MILNPGHPLKDDIVFATCYQLAIEAREETSRGLAELAGKGLMPENVPSPFLLFLYSVPTTSSWTNIIAVTFCLVVKK